MFAGGVWINLGPLLYHYSDMPGEDSVEPTYEMIREIVQGLGFTIEVLFITCQFPLNFLFTLSLNYDPQKEQTGVKTTYSQNVRSMLKYEYDSVFFVCRKQWTIIKKKNCLIRLILFILLYFDYSVTMTLSVEVGHVEATAFN